MGKMSVFTSGQKLIFDQISSHPFLKSNFYFTGGTALSYFYLQHRYSEDLDFFSLKPFNDKKILDIMRRFAHSAGFTFRADLKEVVYMFYLTFGNGEVIKVDFGHYPYKRIEKGPTFQGISIDSLLDIAVNKLSTINQRSSVKDFVDLYYLLDAFTIWDLIEGVGVKFRMEIEHWILASDLGYVVEKFNSMPKMIKPLTLAELKTYYRKLAVDLGKKRVE